MIWQSSFSVLLSPSLNPSWLELLLGRLKRFDQSILIDVQWETGQKTELAGKTVESALLHVISQKVAIHGMVTAQL